MKDTWLILKDNPWEYVNSLPGEAGWILMFQLQFANEVGEPANAVPQFFDIYIFHNIQRIQSNEWKMIKTDKDFMYNVSIIIQKIIEKMNNMI